MSIIKIQDNFYSTIKTALISAGILTAEQNVSIKDIIKILKAAHTANIKNIIEGSNNAYTLLVIEGNVPACALENNGLKYNKIEFIGSGTYAVNTSGTSKLTAPSLTELTIPQNISNFNLKIKYCNSLQTLAVLCGSLSSSISSNSSLNKVFISRKTALLAKDIIDVYSGCDIYTDRLENTPTTGDATWANGWNKNNATVHYGVSYNEFKAMVEESDGDGDDE